MGSSRDDSEEQFSLNTDYSPPATCDLGTQQLIARLAAEEERNDLRADEADDGKKQARKRKLISLVDSEEESDVDNQKIHCPYNIIVEPVLRDIKPLRMQVLT
ncbi:hypothetical protein YC2023_072915 [Brassica napus]